MPWLPLRLFYRQKYEEEAHRRKAEEERRANEDEQRRTREREREIQQLQLFEEKDKELEDLAERVFNINRSYQAVQTVEIILCFVLPIHVGGHRVSSPARCSLPLFWVGWSIVLGWVVHCSGLGGTQVCIL